MNSSRKRKFHGGRWQQQRERCRIDSPVPPPPGCTLNCMKTILTKILKNVENEYVPATNIIELEWEKLVGSAVAAHTRPSRLSEGGKLVVFADSSVWYNEINRYSKQKILANIQSRIGKDTVTAIELRLDPDGPGR